MLIQITIYILTINLYINVLSKSQRRKYTEAHLKNTIENHIELKKDFKERHKGKCSVLLNWKLKNIVDDDLISFDED